MNRQQTEIEGISIGLNWGIKKELYYVEIDEPSNNICTFDTSTNIIRIPDKVNSDPLQFNCTDIKFAEFLLHRFLEVKNKQLKAEYYENRR